jgi:hypothetical protein
MVNTRENGERFCPDDFTGIGLVHLIKNIMPYLALSASLCYNLNGKSEICNFCFPLIFDFTVFILYVWYQYCACAQQDNTHA